VSTVPAKHARRQVEAGAAPNGNLASALLRAAETLVVERGPQAFSLREVARRARVSEAAPYWHFASKEALLAAIAEQGFVTLASGMEKISRRYRDPKRRFHALGVSYVRFALEHPAHLRIMFGPEIHDKRAHPALQTAAERAYALLVTTITDTQRCGATRRGSAADMAIAAWALVHGLSALLIDGQLRGRIRTRRDAENLAARATRLLRVGLGTPHVRRARHHRPPGR
jgi:AcrR family transcriptional regulator